MGAELDLGFWSLFHACCAEASKRFFSIMRLVQEENIGNIYNGMPKKLQHICPYILVHVNVRVFFLKMLPSVFNVVTES